MKARFQVNWRLLGWALAAVVGLAVVVHLVHGFQVRRTAGALLDEAARAGEQGNPDEAAKYLGFYLNNLPEDGSAWAQYGFTLERIDAPASRAAALAALEQALKRDPARPDVRRHLVRLALEQGRFADAQAHALILLETFPQDGELEHAVGRCKEANREYAAAAKWFEHAVRDRPGDVDSCARLARLRRRLDQAADADEVLDRLVAATPQTAEGFLARGRYRLEFGPLDGAAADLARAGELAPDDPEVLLAAAEVDAARGLLAEARAALARGLDRHPRHEAFYHALANLEARSGRRPEAVACLRRGLQVLPERPPLLLALADLLIAEGDQAEAAAILARAAKAGADAAWLQTLHARLLGRQGKWIEAARTLERLRTWVGLPPDFLTEVDLLLGGCYGQLGDPARQMTVYRRGLALSPHAAGLRLAVGAALLGQDRYDEAVAELDQAMGRPGAPPVGWALLARALIHRNQHRPAPQRDWPEVERVLDQAGRERPDSTEVVLLRAAALEAQDRLAEARTLLGQARQKAPRQVELYAAEATLAEQLGQGDDALELLQEAEARGGDAVELCLARARVWTRRGTAEARRQMAALEQGLDRFSAEDQGRLLKGLADAYAQVADFRGAERLWARLAEQQPDDLATRMLLFDRAVRAEDDAPLGRLADEMRRAEGDDGSYWRYAKAVCLLRQAKRGDRAALAEARRHAAAAARRRQDWAKLALLEANLDEAAAEPQQALEHYLKAIELGERQPAVVRRAVQLLAEFGRNGQAAQFNGKLD